MRQKLKSPEKNILAKEMKSFEKVLEDVTLNSVNVKYSFPWERLFEVEIEFS